MSHSVAKMTQPAIRKCLVRKAGEDTLLNFKVVGAVFAALVAGGAWWMMRPSAFDTGSPLIVEGTDVNLLAVLDPNQLSEGWVHRTFFTASAADYQMVQDEDGVALQCTTNNSASILARDTNIPVSALPMLSWDWKVIQPIESNVDEATKDGDDHPARFFVVFSSDTEDRRAMEIIWSCLLYTSPSPRDLSTSRMPSSA